MSNAGSICAARIRREEGVRLPEVRVERVELDAGTPLMYRDFGTYVRLAYDPQQIDEAAALALVCIHEPQLVGNLTVCQAQ